MVARRIGKMTGITGSPNLPIAENARGDHREPVNPVTRSKVKEYPYEDPQGHVQWVKERWLENGKKTFIIRPAGTPTDWVYHLPRIVDSTASEPILFTEGEKDVETLESLGYLATTTCHGANGKLHDSNLPYFVGRQLVLIPDNDAPGLHHARGLGKLLIGRCSEILVAQVPGQKDISDYVEAGAGEAEIEAMLKSAVPFERWLLANPESPKLGLGNNGTHSGNGSTKITEGNRNNHLTSLAGALRRQGAGEEVIRSALVTANEGFPEPLTESEVDRVTTNVAKYTPSADTKKLTDSGNAQRLVEVADGKVRFLKDEESYVVFTGLRWDRQSGTILQAMAKEVSHRMYQLAASMPDDKHREELLKHAAISQSNARIEAMVKLLKSEPWIECPSTEFDDLDKTGLLLNCLNGTVDLTTGVLRPHDRADKITQLCPVLYDQKAEAPLFRKFIEQVCPFPDFLQRLMGYCITGLTHEQVLAVLLGPPGSGKSRFATALRRVLGFDYASTGQTDALLKDRRDKSTQGLASLRGRRLSVFLEPTKGTSFDEALINTLTGEDFITARLLYRNESSFRPTCKILTVCNELPQGLNWSSATWRRLLLVPFPNVFAQTDGDDKRLANKLYAEREGVLRWCVEGALKWNQGGLQIPAELRTLVDKQRLKCDTLGRFIDECCDVGPQYEEQAHFLYDKYKEYCRDGNEFPMTQTAFGSELTRRDYTTRRTKSGVMRKGLRFRPRIR